MSSKTIVLLNEENWTEWRTYFRGRLMQKGLWYTMQTTSSLASDKANEEKAYGLLIDSIEMSQYQYLGDTTTVKTAYAALEVHHEPKARLDRLALRQDYHAMKWIPKQESLPKFLERYENMLRRLRGCDETITNAMAVDRLLELMPWTMDLTTHCASS